MKLSSNSCNTEGSIFTLPNHPQTGYEAKQNAFRRVDSAEALAYLVCCLAAELIDPRETQLVESRQRAAKRVKEMKTKQLPVDLGDWLKVRTFEIGAEMTVRSDSPQL